MAFALEEEGGERAAQKNCQNEEKHHQCVLVKKALAP
jgi:hypothetical protein